jgi:hypothetical protein
MVVMDWLFFFGGRTGLGGRSAINAESAPQKRHRGEK